MNQKLRQLLAKGNAASIKAIVNHYKKQDLLTQMLLDEWLVEEINKHNSNFLHWLAFLGETNVVRNLLQAGAAFYKLDKFGNTPLHLAAAEQHCAVVELLLKADNQFSRQRKLPTHLLDMFRPNNTGKTPVGIAGKTGNTQLINLFKKHRQAFLYDATRTQTTTAQSTNVIATNGNSSYQPNWQNVACSGFNYNWLVNPTGQLVTVKNDGTVEQRLCSGVNIGNGYFLTAGHCLGNVCYDVKNQGATNYRVSFNYQLPICPTTGNSTIQENIYSMRVVEHGTCNGIDYAVFKLDPAAEKYFGHVNLATALPAQGASVVIAHHPNGLPKQLSTGAVTSTESKAGKVEHSAHTWWGSSGSPVGNTAKREVFAVHVEGTADQKYHAALSVKAIAEKSAVVSAMTKHGFLRNSSTSSPTSSSSALDVAPSRRHAFN